MEDYFSTSPWKLRVSPRTSGFNIVFIWSDHLLLVRTGDGFIINKVQALCLVDGKSFGESIGVLKSEILDMIVVGTKE